MEFSTFSEDKKDIKRKQEELYKYYESSQDCLNSTDEQVRALLEQDIADLKDKIVSHKRNLKKEEYIVFVTGERCLEKSNLLNLIIDEQLFPCFVVSTSSTVFELKYGTEPKLVAHEHSDTKVSTEILFQSESLGTLQRGCLQQLLSTIFKGIGGENSTEDPRYEKIELFLPHKLLKEGIVIVDIPGTYESPIINEKAKAYLLEASAFICSINGVDGEGIHRDEVEKYIEHAKQVSAFLYQQLKSSSNCPLLVFTKRDQVLQQEAYRIKSCIINHLTERWPSEDPESQIIFLSPSNESNAWEAPDDAKCDLLMNRISSTVLKSIETNLEKQWRWLYHLLSRMAYRTKVIRRDCSEVMRFVAENQQGAVEKELTTTIKASAARELFKFLNSPELQQYFTSWSLDNVPDVGGDWSVTEENIKKALVKRLQEKIEEWEKQTNVFSESRTLLTQDLFRNFERVERQNQNVQSPPKADSVASSSSSSSGPQTSRNLSLTETVIIGVTSPIWVPVGFVAFLFSAPVIGTIAAKERFGNRSKTKEYKKDKCKFMAEASQEYLTKMADEQQVMSLVEEELKTEKLLIQQKRLLQDVRDLYIKISDLRGKMADFGIKEVGTMDISCEDLEWKDDRGSPLGSGSFASVHRGTLKLPEKEKPVDVALKVWKKALTSGSAINFLSETDTLRKLNHPFIVKMYGATLLKEKGESRPILVMELCKENLMKHIFRNQDNVPGLSTTTSAAKNVIGWAKDIANALEFIHNKGIIHRDLKLENTLLSYDNVVKVADVGLSKEEDMITGTQMGTPNYMAPEVASFRRYDRKADIYSFGVMLWEMWYGKRAFHGIAPEDLQEQVAQGVRPEHVQDSREPPNEWRDLMQRCWNGAPDQRPISTACHKELTRLYEETTLPL